MEYLWTPNCLELRGGYWKECIQQAACRDEGKYDRWGELQADVIAKIILVYQNMTTVAPTRTPYVIVKKVKVVCVPHVA